MKWIKIQEDLINYNDIQAFASYIDFYRGKVEIILKIKLKGSNSDINYTLFEEDFCKDKTHYYNLRIKYMKSIETQIKDIELNNKYFYELELNI